MIDVQCTLYCAACPDGKQKVVEKNKFGIDDLCVQNEDHTFRIVYKQSSCNLSIMRSKEPGRLLLVDSKVRDPSRSSFFTNTFTIVSNTLRKPKIAWYLIVGPQQGRCELCCI